ncbi:MAG: lysophospholipid acyltransferase family protein [Anaerolineae bacterium]
MKISRLRRFGNWLFGWLLPLIVRLRITGRENVPPTGRVLIAPNHANFLDPFLIQVGMKRLLIFFAKKEVFDWPILGPLAPHYHIIPVDRGAADATAVKRSLQVLKAEEALYIAPEGTRSKTGQLQQGHSGAVVLATRANAPIVPVGVWGQKALWSELMRLRRPRIGLSYGKPFRFAGAARPSRDELDAMTVEMMYRIAAQLPPEWRGVYAGEPPAWRYTVDLDAAEPQPSAAAASQSHPPSPQP